MREPGGKMVASPMTVMMTCLAHIQILGLTSTSCFIIRQPVSCKAHPAMHTCTLLNAANAVISPCSGLC